MTVISLADRRAAKPEPRDPHLTGSARCIQCTHQWEAVAPVGTTWMECPACHCHKAAFIGPCEAKEGDLLWACNCGSSLFYITKAEGPVCHGCGVPATGWFK